VPFRLAFPRQSLMPPVMLSANEASGHRARSYTYLTEETPEFLLVHASSLAYNSPSRRERDHSGGRESKRGIEPDSVSS